MKKINKLNYKDLAIVYVVSILFLHFIQVILFGNAINTLVSNLAIVILLVPIGSIFTSRKLIDVDANGNNKNKVEKIIDKYKLIFLSILFLTFSIYGIINNPYYLASYQILVTALVMIVWEIRKRGVNFKSIEVKEEVIFGIICLILIDTLTIIFLLFVKPVTVIEAQSKVRLEGFEKIEYTQIIVSIADDFNSYKDKDLISYAKSDLQDNKLRYYFFIADKDSVDYAVLVDVLTGEVMK
jgi:uncharacterized membrane protein YhaH (DUF805 family)